MSDQPEDPSPEEDWLRAPIDWQEVWVDWLGAHGGMTFALLIVGVTMAFLTDVWLGLGVLASMIIVVLGIVFLARRSKKDDPQEGKSSDQ